MKSRYVTLTSTVHSAVLMSLCLASTQLRAEGLPTTTLAPMWGDQVVPDFSKLKTSAAETTEQGRWIVQAINLFQCATQPLPSDHPRPKVRAVACDGPFPLKLNVRRIDSAIRGEAFASRGDDGQLVIYYSAAFEGKLERPDYLGKYITLAHEVSHHLLGHTKANAPPITQQDELKADQMAGCLLSAVVRNLHRSLGPKEFPAEPVYYNDFDQYFTKYPRPADNAKGDVHADVGVRLKWVASGFNHASVVGPCRDIPPYLPPPR